MYVVIDKLYISYRKGVIIMIKINNLSKSFRKTRVLNDINLEIKEHSCTALIGKNGAGKSTLIDILIGNMHGDKGEIIDKSRMINQHKLAILFQKTNFPKFFKVKELFKLHQSFYANSISTSRFLDITQFSEAQMNQMANQLSGGQKRILDFALTLVGQPEFLILDEPTTAMDIETREHFWRMIEDLKSKNVTILYTSHYIEEVERMADHVVLLDEGRIQLSDSPEQIKNQQTYSTVVLPPIFKDIVEELEIEFEISKYKNNYEVRTNHVDTVIHKLIDHHIDLNQIEIHKTSLLDIMFSNNSDQEGVTL
ncbi:TPA: ABC transporter ATP-binding protein [Pseudomonas aeruginosa]|nr:ABC transporter ATP-binding protein [Pseudomonas aeruginosa]